MSFTLVEGTRHRRGFSPRVRRSAAPSSSGFSPPHHGVVSVTRGLADRQLRGRSGRDVHDRSGSFRVGSGRRLDDGQLFRHIAHGVRDVGRRQHEHELRHRRSAPRQRRRRRLPRRRRMRRRRLRGRPRPTRRRRRTTPTTTDGSGTGSSGADHGCPATTDPGGPGPVDHRRRRRLGGGDPGVLPATGTDTSLGAVIGGSLLLVGGAVLFAGRRKSPQATDGDSRSECAAAAAHPGSSGGVSPGAQSPDGGGGTDGVRGRPS